MEIDEEPTLPIKKTPGGKKTQGGESEMALRSMETIEESVTVGALGEIKVEGEKIVPEIF